MILILPQLLDTAGAIAKVQLLSDLTINGYIGDLLLESATKSYHD
jgi:hypothetical protein